MNNTLKFFFPLFLSILCGNITLAQSNYDKIFKVADNIIENTSFKIIDTETKKLYDCTEGLPVSKNYRIESPYNMWHYWNGVLAIGMIQLSEISGNEKYKEYALKNYDFIFDNLDYFGKQYNAGIHDISIYQYFEMGLLDHCGAMSSGLYDVSKFDAKKEYDTYLDRAINYVANKEIRLEDGTFVRKKPREMTLWADDLYMGVPFLARMALKTGDSKYLDDAIVQVKNFNKYLFNQNNGLYYHCYYSDNKQNGVAHWGRCNGWVIMSEVELINLLPENHPERNALINILEKHIIGISRHQDISGMWHQLIDTPDSYLESSATAMFIYGVAKAVNEGWINQSYASIAFSGWSGLGKKITEEGLVENICVGTGIKDDIQYYYNRKKELNDIHGLGAIILAGVEMMKLDIKTK